MLLSQGTKEDLLISICLVCFGTVVLGFFDVHICIYRSIYTHDRSIYTHDSEWTWIQFYILLKNSFLHQRILPAKYFCSFPIKTFNVLLSNIFTVLSWNKTHLTLCLLLAAAVRLCRKSDRSHLFK